MKARQATELERLFARFDRARDERLNAGELRRRASQSPAAKRRPAAQPARARGRSVLFALLLGVLVAIFATVLATALALLSRTRHARSA